MKKTKTPKTPKVKTWIVDRPEGYKIFEGVPRKIGFWKGLGAVYLVRLSLPFCWVQVLSSINSRYYILVS